MCYKVTQLLVPFHAKQAERLKSCERRPELNRLDGQWAQWSIGSMVYRLVCYDFKLSWALGAIFDAG